MILIVPEICLKCRNKIVLGIFLIMDWIKLIPQLLLIKDIKVHLLALT